MAKTEFISAASLPEATGDEVSVLCVENGALKQKAAKGLGGGGIIVMFDSDTFDGSSYAILSIPEDFYETLSEMWDSGMITSNICVYSRYNYDGDAGIMAQPFKKLAKEDNIFVVECGYYRLYAAPDGTTSVEYYD